MNIIPYILNILGLSSSIASLLIKGEKMKLTLFLVFCGNFLIATGYLVEGRGINGAATCYLGSLLTIINYFYSVKNKPYPKWLLISYGVAFTIVNILVSGGITPLGLLIIIASLTFVMSITQNNGAKYRIWILINVTLWCIYDIIAHSYSALITHSVLFMFSLIGMFIYDRKTDQ